MVALFEASVSPDAEEFNLAFNDKWVKVVGHLIIVNEFQFSAVPSKNIFRVSEVKSGAKLIDVTVPEHVESYEETILFLELRVIPQIVTIINKIGTKSFKKQIEQMKKVAIAKLGQMPPTKKINTEWLKEVISEILN